MGANLTQNQRMAVMVAKAAQNDRELTEQQLAGTVRRALKAGVPLNTLATALGVSRSRVRRLARVEKSE